MRGYAGVHACQVCHAPGAHFKTKAIHRIRKTVNGSPVAEVWETLSYRLCQMCHWFYENDIWTVRVEAGECVPFKSEADGAASKARCQQLGIGDG